MPTGIYTIVFELRKEKHPCSLCAMLRRGALHDAALAQGCRKVALGHHFDDAVETLLLNLFNEGRLGCFSPVSYLDRKGITLIRPLLYKMCIRDSCIIERVVGSTPLWGRRLSADIGLFRL